MPLSSDYFGKHHGSVVNFVSRRHEAALKWHEETLAIEERYRFRCVAGPMCERGKERGKTWENDDQSLIEGGKFHADKPGEVGTRAASSPDQFELRFWIPHPYQKRNKGLNFLFRTSSGRIKTFSSPWNNLDTNTVFNSWLFMKIFFSKYDGSFVEVRVLNLIIYRFVHAENILTIYRISRSRKFVSLF